MTEVNHTSAATVDRAELAKRVETTPVDGKFGTRLFAMSDAERDLVVRLLRSGDAAQAGRDPKREWISPVKTVGDLVNNLLGLDQNNEIYGAYHLDLGDRKECKTRGLSLSRERVLHNGKIDDKDPNWALTGYSTVIWSAPDPRWDCGVTLQAKRPGIDRWFDVNPDEVELLCNDGCFIRALAAQPLAAPATKSAPARYTPQNYAERPPSSDAAEVGAGTRCSAATAKPDIEARIAVLFDALKSISKNTCCDNCREAANVARSALAAYVGLARESALQSLADIDRDLIGHDETMANLNALTIRRP
jgi:hypothetical protein